MTKKKSTAPPPEDPVVEETKVDPAAQDEERGYQIGSWGARPIYIEIGGPYATLDEEAMKRHVAARRRLNRRK